MKRFLTNSLQRITGKLKGENSHEPELEYELEVKPESEPELKLKPLNELEKIEFSPLDYEKTSNFQENIRLYQEALEKIRAKYRTHVLDAYYLNGEDLIRVESKRDNFCRKANISPEELEQKINDFCQKNNIPNQELYIPKADVDPVIKEELEQTIAAEVELEQIKFLDRDDNCSEERLKEGVALAKIYRSPEEIDVLEKMSEEAKAKGGVRDGVKLMITNTILNDIVLDSNLAGERREGTKYASNWEKKLDLLKEELEEKGIYLNENYEGHQVHVAEIRQTWDEVNKQIKEKNAVKRGFKNILSEVFRKYPQVGLEYYAAELEEQHGKTKKTRGLEEYLKDAREFASNSADSRAPQEKATSFSHISRDIEDIGLEK